MTYREAHVSEGVALPRRATVISSVATTIGGAVAAVAAIGWISDRAGSLFHPVRDGVVTAFAVAVTAAFAFRIASGRRARVMPLFALALGPLAFGVIASFPESRSTADGLAFELNAFTEALFVGATASIASLVAVACASFFAIANIDMRRMPPAATPRAPVIAAVIVAVIHAAVVRDLRAIVAVEIAAAAVPIVATRLRRLDAWHDERERAHVAHAALACFLAIGLVVMLLELFRFASEAQRLFAKLELDTQICSRIGPARTLASAPRAYAMRAIAGGMAVFAIGALALGRRARRPNLDALAPAVVLAFVVVVLGVDLLRVRQAARYTAEQRPELKSIPVAPCVRGEQFDSALVRIARPDALVDSLADSPLSKLLVEGTPPELPAGIAAGVLGPRYGAIPFWLSQGPPVRGAPLMVVDGDRLRVGFAGENGDFRWVERAAVLSLADDDVSRADRRAWLEKRGTVMPVLALEQGATVQRFVDVVMKLRASEQDLLVSLARGADRESVVLLVNEFGCKGLTPDRGYDHLARVIARADLPGDGSDRPIVIELGPFVLSYRLAPSYKGYPTGPIRDARIRDAACSDEGLEVPEMSPGSSLRLSRSREGVYMLESTSGMALGFRQGP